MIGTFLLEDAKARINGLSGGYDVHVNLELIERYHGSIDGLLAASYRPLENTSSPMEVEKLTSREVGILDRRISASDNSTTDMWW